MLLRFALFSLVIIFDQHFSSVDSVESTVIFRPFKKIFHNVPKISIRVGIGSISSNIVSLSSRISKNGTFNELSSKYNIQEPWNAPKFVWTWAWKLHTIMLPILHYFDKCFPQDTFVNLSVLWWKSISGSNRHGPLYDYGIAYDFLPPFMRIIVSYPLCLLYPKLHHQNVALRTLYLDEVIEEQLNNNISDLQSSSSGLLLTPSTTTASSAASLSSPKTHVLTLGAGFDTRSLRLALQHHNHTTWHEFDLSRVIQQKQSVLNRYLQRRQRFYNKIIKRESCLTEDLIPKLYSIDMNNISAVVESLHTALSSISVQKGDKVIFITEASLLYLNQSVVAPLLASCMKTAGIYVDPRNIKYCFADRFPLPCTDFMSSTAGTIQTATTKSTTTTAITMIPVTHRNNITTSSSIYDIDIGVEKEEALSFFHSVGMKVDTWQIKPGRARHMGVASVL